MNKMLGMLFLGVVVSSCQLLPTKRLVENNNGLMQFPIKPGTSNYEHNRARKEHKHARFLPLDRKYRSLFYVVKDEGKIKVKSIKKVRQAKKSFMVNPNEVSAENIVNGKRTRKPVLSV
jgi:hypothetical protein